MSARVKPSFTPTNYTTNQQNYKFPIVTYHTKGKSNIPFSRKATN